MGTPGEAYLAARVAGSLAPPSGAACPNLRLGQHHHPVNERTPARTLEPAPPPTAARRLRNGPVRYSLVGRESVGVLRTQRPVAGQKGRRIVAPIIPKRTRSRSGANARAEITSTSWPPGGKFDPAQRESRHGVCHCLPPGTPRLAAPPHCLRVCRSTTVSGKQCGGASRAFPGPSASGGTPGASIRFHFEILDSGLPEAHNA
jgi:hypothetical protein